MSRIFVIDDEPAIGENIQRLLRAPELEVTTFQDPAKGLSAALSSPPDLVLLDIRMPGMSGEEVFARLHEAYPGMPIVFLTAFSSVEGAVAAMRTGAFDYIQKPFKREELLLAVNRALSHATLEHEVERLQGRLEALGETDYAHSRSPAMLEQIEKCRRAAATDATVMILGESGTGKEVIARFIHNQSPRKNGPFVAVECSAMPGSLIESELFGYERGAFTGAERTKKGLIESAHGGTLFLDEIGDLGVELQTRLFRFVEERELRRLGGLTPVRVDCRILCATNQDLTAKIKAGTLPRGTVLPAQRGDRQTASSARTAGGHSSPGALLPGTLLAPLRQEPLRFAAVLRGFAAAAVAGQCPAAQERDGEADRPPARRRLWNPKTWRRIFRLPARHSHSRRLPWKEAREQYLAGFEAPYGQALLARCDGNISAAAREAGVDRKTFYAPSEARQRTPCWGMNSTDQPGMFRGISSSTLNCMSF